MLRQRYISQKNMVLHGQTVLKGQTCYLMNSDASGMLERGAVRGPIGRPVTRKDGAPRRLVASFDNEGKLMVVLVP